MLDKELLAELKTLIVSHIETCAYSKDRQQEVLHSIHTLLEDDCDTQANESISLNDFLFRTASLNEKTSKRKRNGVYYTDDDVVEYIVGNAFLNYVDTTIDNVHPYGNCISRIKDLGNECINKLLCASIFDPTCGTGQFLIQAIKTKCTIIDDKLNDETLESIVTTIHGNDIDSFSIKIAMIRIFFFVEAKVKDFKTLAHITNTLKKNFAHKDYINDYERDKRYEIIIGNPPYVEYGKLEKKPEVLMGNTYANVMYNSERQLFKKGIMAYIVPLSFVSTPRMKKIRDDVKEQSQKMFVINFADRPDCLFSSVHQKLTIVIAIKGTLDCKVFSSIYYYWYKSERKKLFEKCSTIPSAFNFEEFIPKIGDAIGLSIFNKVLRKDEIKLADLQTEEIDSQSIYLNMRGTFWVKAFMQNPGSREYKQLRFPKEVCPYIISILNSSLFFFYWSVVSDCWHITSKELDNFKIITKADFSKFEILSQQLLDRLEETKSYIGTVQCDYEYKHKYCKNEIDAIDDALAKIYGLTDEELNYVKSYQLKYRMSDEK